MKSTLKLEPTSRGFIKGKFTDKYGQECSIQKSSRIGVGPSDECIWLGVSNNEGKYQVCRRNGTGWEEHSLEEDYPNCDIAVPDRMHLNQQQIKDLLPLLQHFAETGELPNEEPKAEPMPKDECQQRLERCAQPLPKETTREILGLKDDTYQRISTIIEEQLGVHNSEFLFTIPLDDPIFNMDSLDGVELTMSIEEEFGFEISEYDAEKAKDKTIGDIVKYIDERIKNKPYFEKGYAQGRVSKANGNSPTYLVDDEQGADSPEHAELIRGYISGYGYDHYGR